MKKIKILLTALAFTACSSSFAAPANLFFNAPRMMASSQCDSKEGSAWCQCYYGHLMKNCTEMGGGAQCSDKFVRDQISEFGGPEVVCNMMPPAEGSVESCISGLTRYLKECPHR